MKKENFFDRRHYLDLLEKRITGLKDGYRQNVAFIGDELVGKTSIVFKFLSRFFDAGIVTVYVEIRPEKFPVFVKRFLGVLLYSFHSNAGTTGLKEDFDYLLEKTEAIAPRTAEKIRALTREIENRKRDNVFSELLSLCDILHQETNKYFVIFFDEFHNLETLGSKDIFAEWSRVLIAQKHVLYVILSSMKTRAHNILSKHLCLLFGNFEIVSVEPFGPAATEEYLAQNLRVLSINKGTRDFLAHLTGGSPFYLHVISDALLKSPSMGIVDVLDELLFSPAGVLNQKFTSCLKRLQDDAHGRDLASALFLISNGQNKIRDISQITHKPSGEVKSLLTCLFDSEVINRSGDFLRINDRVFSFWLKFVYQQKMNSLTFDAKNQNLQFRKKLESIIQEYLAHSNKSILERTADLLKLFEDESIQIEKKKLKLNRFREIKPLEFNAHGIKEGLVCRSTDSLWLIGFNHDSLTEDDISFFSKECKKYKQKLQRKIIISCKDIDPNSKLRALEEKVWTWDLQNLNQIMDAFLKPRVIV